MIANSDIDSHQFLIRFEDSFRYARGIISTKAGFPLANFFARIDLLPLSASILPRLADV
jgi:hypothetical protein